MVESREREVALAAVRAAAQLCHRFYQSPGCQSLEKADASPVTAADFGSQALICQALGSAFPKDAIVAEEDATLLQRPEFAGTFRQVIQAVGQFLPGATGGEILDWIGRGRGQLPPRYWTLDPIDGTKGFLRGGQYAIALALLEGGEVQLGLLACPALPFPGTPPSRGTLFTAVRGEGAMALPLPGGEGKPIRVNPSGEASQLQRIESVESAHSDRGAQERLDRLLGCQRPPRQMDSQAKYGAVAWGEADLYLRVPLPQFARRGENVWDHAAGSLVVQEAGGRVTDLAGHPLDFSAGPQLSRNRGIVASNGAVHEQVLAAIAAAL